ncbi:PilZ domain-containing protein [Alteromonas sp. a30]|uniref:PilZ domain-containing protein n=1 Tax=Alteromonas sp. a30 TaxID=2730917 RepID=UPI00227E5616|nr:PilZ domain-containing protein [Alteromonas sp. a30]MCY7296397.1 PilZ domain-containing protein [Alteromonas sp. a30]
MLGYDDKRAYFRMIMNSPCELKIKNQDSPKVLTAVCKDISAVGMSFEIEEAVELEQELEVAIESTNAQIASLSAEVKVVRCIKQDDTTYVIGVEIIHMN